jgi:hypothetical protein
MSGYFRGNWSSTSNSTAADSSTANPTTANSCTSKTDKSDQSNRYKTDQHTSETDQPAQSIKSNREIYDYDRICRVDPVNRQFVVGYTQLVSDRMNDGWSCHFITFPFAQLPGPRGAVIQAMNGEIQRSIRRSSPGRIGSLGPLLPTIFRSSSGLPICRSTRRIRGLPRSSSATAAFTSTSS